MPNLVKDVLLVASPYDRFILEEDGRFADRLLSQYVEMDLSAPPHFDHVPSARQALEQLNSVPYDLVLTTPHCSDMGPLELASRVRASHPDTPVAMVTYDRADAQKYSQRPRSQGLDQVFLWTGDSRLLVTLVKSVEDMLNVDHDTRKGLVRVIIVVEDSPAFYSSYLPIIYGEILGQVKTLLERRLNERDRHYRTRARPKILLARTFEEAKELFEKYESFVLGTICDLRFPRLGQLDPQAGRRFIDLVRSRLPDLPVLLQSRESEQERLAQQLGVHFADKNSPELLKELQKFIRKNFGFGSFVFKDLEGVEVDRADDLTEMLEAIRRVPEESLRDHAARNHISNWLMARSEFGLAMEVRPRRVSDFSTTEDLRNYLTEIFSRFLERQQKGEVTEFVRGTGARERDFSRLGSGSMGGKGRGIAFVSHLLAGHPIHEKYPGIRIQVPRTAVLCTDIFEHYCDTNQLRERALEAQDDVAVVQLFLEQPLEEEVMKDLAAILASTRYPLAVRSSSLHEDSEFLPLAGLYKTFMIPNCSDSEDLRLEQLSKTIRLIFASTFLQASRSYLEANSLRVEEEKMAVIVERLVGRRYGERFYPNFAGVAQSYNYYPVGYMKPEDGIATVALGLGQTIVEGRRALRFCPAHPHILPQMPNPDKALRNSQREAFALDLSDPDFEPNIDDSSSLVLFDLAQAEKDGTLEALGGTYSPENDSIYDSIYRDGHRLVNFAGVLKHDRFPLAGVLADLLKLGEEGMGTPVELEFAVSLGQGDEPPEMAILQLRPLVAQGRESEVSLEDTGAMKVPFLSGPALGNGVIRGLQDVVYVHPERLDLAHSKAIATEIERINYRQEQAQRPYILIGPGRWGTADPWLGIPVEWRQVSAVKVIVELELPGLSIDPSQGTHFFHNLTSLRIGYFSLNLGNIGHLVDFRLLESLPSQTDSELVRHVALPEPVEVYIDGRVRMGLALRR
ncbi:MAG: hypothetical protein K0U98_19310 [Deltaproteobacteria bacterium]|nr:hypothetical protein [Deltaproteobacteria bacterium]